MCVDVKNARNVGLGCVLRFLRMENAGLYVYQIRVVYALLKIVFVGRSSGDVFRRETVLSDDRLTVSNLLKFFQS